MCIRDSPEFVILDEPTVGLDHKYQLEFREFLRQDKAQRRLTLISSHLNEDFDHGIHTYLKVEGGRVALERVQKTPVVKQWRYLRFSRVEGFEYQCLEGLVVHDDQVSMISDNVERDIKRLIQSRVPLPGLEVGETLGGPS